MVAISLYRGNLHRVPDVPRRWLMPTPKISFKDFKSLLTRRSVALSRLRSALPAAAAVSSNPNPDFIPGQLSEAPKAGNLSHPTIKFEAPENVAADCEAGPSGKKKDGKQSDGADLSVKSGGGFDSPPALKPDLIEKGSDVADVGASSLPVKVEKLDEVENPNSERCNKEEELSDKQKRKREVEEKLQVLNQKKHNLVQVLKQILNAEEELKRRNCMQGVVVRPSVSLQVDVTNDSGSMTRHAAARLGSEANLEMEGVEGDELSNHNFHSRHMLRMNSTSPSSESPLRRPAHIQHNVVPHPSRASLGPTGTSPSRFAPIGQQGHPANLPTVSASGTNYMASSPSPAASGGTSAFKDARLPSPWN
ncbi:hypothetical protein D8674_029690 [Pyrus ussuriensis x Pyrus communis]|uniref:Uncharacterized protein n=1 Tax=Pyrus ussuriensis x Pyrus communis TaxID=2448454 RepID=A0A5N5I2U2_9ROSA|nr:hypothetical protein D8674_029690 [Pyrus ussuriensis x Pyrus communis]